MRKIFRHEGVSLQKLDHLTWYMIFGTLIGARLGHCLFYEPDFYLPNPVEIIKIWNGGLASHGAAVGILIALYVFSRFEHCSYVWILDRITIVVALSCFLIRMGNLMNSEIYGISTNLPWGFVFVRERETIPRHPTQIYEAFSYLIIFIVLCQIYRKNKGNPYPGVLMGAFFVLIFVVRFLIEFIKENQVAFENGMLLNMGQILSIPFIILGIYLLLRPKSFQNNPMAFHETSD